MMSSKNKTKNKKEIEGNLPSILTKYSFRQTRSLRIISGQPHLTKTRFQINFAIVLFDLSYKFSW